MVAGVCRNTVQWRKVHRNVVHGWLYKANNSSSDCISQPRIPSNFLASVDFVKSGKISQFYRLCLEPFCACVKHSSADSCSPGGSPIKSLSECKVSDVNIVLK